ncbi:GvpL/GvpF family gas vesicle protein [Streptomyces sp. ISL-10]|uniref:GvpL/GvpF family gas vesicle protein n=1 Tax=Streptomyces sp. ISL-10 TaxID=2819172 RepID=UPI001BE8B904|nr:GvpL/GvpF family gas vesicle protein [Streptomyces sp. ISL-10]MBT2365662.1 GvpL/GvpF family gas vesicle protein [Streptomyces sp. ISL-10]
MSETVGYLYGVAAATTELHDAVAGLRGVYDAAVRVVTDQDVAAVVSDVPSADFEEAPLAAHLEDLAWLESVARAHHGVVDAVTARTTVLPLRLGTIYRDDEGIRTMLAAGRAAFLPRLARLGRHVEWGVKVFFVPPATGGPGGAPDEPATELSPGRAYLRGRRHEQHTRDRAYQEALEAAQRIHAAAAARAVEHTRHRVQQGALAEGLLENIANDAYLVATDMSDAFLAAVRQADEGAELVRTEITGPWAPYSFAAAAPDETGAGSGLGDQEDTEATTG